MKSNIGMLALMASMMAGAEHEGMVDPVPRVRRRTKTIREEIDALRSEYELIQRKESSLSANQRAMVVDRYERLLLKQEAQEARVRAEANVEQPKMEL